MPVATASAVGLVGIDFSVVTTTQKFPLGMTANAANGQRYRYIRAGATIAQYDALTYDSEGVYDYQPTSATLQPILGIAQVAVADNSYSWVLIGGKGLVKVAATIAAGAHLVSTGTAGTLDDTAAAADVATAEGAGIGVMTFLDDSPSAGIASVNLQ